MGVALPSLANEAETQTVEVRLLPGPPFFCSFLYRHFAWQAQHFRRVVLRDFCESQCQGKWRQGANSVAKHRF